MKELITERFGTLIKQESLTCVENELLMPDTCVLEAISPFYDYYDSVTTGSKPLYLYLMLDDTHSLDEVHIAIFNVEKKAGFPFDAVKACIDIGGLTQVNAIRVRSLERYNQIAELQKLLINEGIRFRKKTRAIENFPALIRLEKFFFVEDWGDGMYFDHKVPHHGYFEIAKVISWPECVELTREAKYDTNLLFFDAGLARFYSGSGFTNLIRIYKEHLDRMQLEAIKKRYLHLMGT